MSSLTECRTLRKIIKFGPKYIKQIFTPDLSQILNVFEIFKGKIEKPLLFQTLLIYLR